MSEHDLLAQQFEQQRGHLRAVAYRMLGSLHEADDAVQEAWLRLSRTDAGQIETLGGWLTTVVARVCLDMLRSRKSRREDSVDTELSQPIVSPAGGPEQEAILAQSVGRALLVVLETLAPAERVAFVLHDMFAMPFEEIAAIVGRTPVAVRQLASRARRRVQGVDTVPAADLGRRQQVIDAFLAAARSGSFDALLAVLDPDVVVRADRTAVSFGAASENRGADAAATRFLQARGARPVLVDGVAGLVWAPGGRPRVVFSFTVTGDRITAVDLIADPERLRSLDLIILESPGALPVQ